MNALQIIVPEIAADVLNGLSANPKRLPPKLLYDARGSELFEQITRLPEYYLTRTEASILRSRGSDIASRLPADVSVVELGAGNAQKTPLILNAIAKRQASVNYVPVDISSAALEAAKRSIKVSCPDAVKIQPYEGDLNDFRFLDGAKAPRLVMYLGSSIGNFDAEDAVEFLNQLRKRMDRADRFLLGADAVKSAEILVPAYNDAAGVTSAFTRNVLTRINRELGANFREGEFEHVARWNPEASRMEMYLESQRSQTVNIAALGRSFGFQAGELLHTENSYKYTVESLRNMLRSAGFRDEVMWQDPRAWFHVVLARTI